MDFTEAELAVIAAALSNIHKPVPVAPEKMALLLGTLQKVQGYLVGLKLAREAKEAEPVSAAVGTES